jgi:hypothetical protein
MPMCQVLLHDTAVVRQATLCELSAVAQHSLTTSRSAAASVQSLAAATVQGSVHIRPVVKWCVVNWLDLCVS